MKKKHFLTRNFYILVAFYAVAVFLSNDMFLPALESISKYLGATKASVSAGVGVFIFGALVSLFFAGPLSDKIGRRNALIYGGVFFALSTVGIIFTHHLYSYLIFRFLEGAGTCMVSAAGMASINEYYSEKQAIKAISLTVNVIMLSPIMGPIMGASIIKFLPWQGIFVIDLVFIIIILILIYFYMPETSDQKHLHAHTLLENFQGMKIAFQNRGFILHSLSVTAYAGTFIVWITAGNHMLIDNLHQTPQAYSFLQVPILLAYMIGNTISPIISRKVDTRKFIFLITKGMLFTILILLIFNAVLPDTLLLLIVTLSIVMLGRGFLNAPYMQYILSLEKKYPGSTASTQSIIINSGLVLASALATVLYQFNNFQYILLMLTFSLFGIVFTYLGKLYIKQNVNE